MKRFPHRVIFRMTEKDWIDFGGLIGKVYGVANWSDLCRHGLLLAFQEHAARQLPLGSRAPDLISKGMTTENPKDQRKASAALANKTLQKYFTEGKIPGNGLASSKKKNPSRMKKTVDKRRRHKV